LRVGEAIRHALTEALRGGRLRDPILNDASITVSEARVAPDLQNCTVFVMPLGGRDVAEVVAALNRAAPFLRGEVARACRLKFAPQLRFRRDESFDQGQRMENVLRSPPVARDTGRDDDG
jgi:ribosome-binding factor A